MVSPNDQDGLVDQMGASSNQTASTNEKKPKGRALSEILGNGPLTDAEIKLLKGCAEGTLARIARSIPSERIESNVIRADLIRFLALGGDGSAPVHERGVSIHGAWIEGTVDLIGCEVECPLSFTDCRITGDLLLNDGRISTLNLSASTVGKIRGDRLKCSGSILLRNNFHAKGIVRFPRASITGDLELTQARIEGNQIGEGERIALFCARIEIGGGVLAASANPKQPFSAEGRVDFYGAKIGGDFRFSKAIFASKSLGLMCDLAEIGGTLSLEECDFSGRVRLLGAKVSGDMNLKQCNFNNNELILTRSNANGRFIFREITGSISRLSLRAAKVDALVDDIASWDTVKNLILDGFEYARILDIGYHPREGEYVQIASAVDATSRIRWLKLQNELDLGRDFKPQPWEQLVAVLSEMGHEDDARVVAIEKQKQKQRAWFLQSRAKDLGLAKRVRLLSQISGHYMYGVLSRYGYRPSLLVGWALAAALMFSGIFELAEWAGVMAPTDRTIVGSAEYGKCRPHAWATCSELRGRYPAFDPIVYSFDLILPVIATQHVREWAPLITKPDGSRWRLGMLVWILSRVENLFGWVLGLMFVATVAGFIKRD